MTKARTSLEALLAVADLFEPNPMVWTRGTFVPVTEPCMCPTLERLVDATRLIF